MTVDHSKPVYKNHDLIVELCDRAATIGVWDFNVALGNTMGEKFESMYIKLIEITDVLIRKGANGYFWIVTSPEMTAMFETGKNLVTPEDHIKMGDNEIRYAGLLSRRWKVWSDPQMKPGHLLIGVGETPQCFEEFYGFMKVENFIV